MEINITASLINSYCICSRKSWLQSRNISPDYSNHNILVGRLINESFYSRQRKSISLDNMKLDIIKRRDGITLVCEIKKSSAGEKAAIMQLAYYLYKFKQYGIIAKGEILIPMEKKIKYIELNKNLELELMEKIEKLKNELINKKPPKVKRIKYCAKCAYYNFCFI